MKRLLPANQRDERWCGRGWSHQQRDKEDFPESEEIINENQKNNMAQNATLRNSSLDRNMGGKNSIEGQTLAAAGEEVSEP